MTGQDFERASRRRVPDETALAWELAAAARPQLTAAGAHRVHIAIGIGETFAAIDVLLSTIAGEQIPITPALAALVGVWLDCYTGHNDHPRLRDLLAHCPGSTIQN